jgi:hypothetical protein
LLSTKDVGIEWCKKRVVQESRHHSTEAVYDCLPRKFAYIVHA